MLASAARLKLPVLPQVGPNYIGMWVIFTSVLTDTKVDNVEGMSFGPTLPDGHTSLILVSDNNFSTSQHKTQFIILRLDSLAKRLPTGWALAGPASTEY